MTFEQWFDAYTKAQVRLSDACNRYNDTVSGERFGDLYGDDCEGNKVQLVYPVQWGLVIYFVTEEFQRVYKFNEDTGKYRESKTAYKLLQRREHAINIAREHLHKVIRAYGEMPTGTPTPPDFDEGSILEQCRALA